MIDRRDIYVAIRMLLMAAAVGGTASCAGSGLVPDGGDGGSSLSVSFIVNGSAGTATRSYESSETEDGNDALNENLIERMDIFVYDSDGNRELHKSTEETAVTITGPDSDSGLYTFTAAGVPNTGYLGRTIYIVANWTDADDASTSTVTELQAAMAVQHSESGSEGFIPNVVQKAFLMDGSCITSDDNTVTETEDGSTKTTIAATDPIKLRRAVAKIRLHILNADGKEIYPEHLFYRLMNYAGEVSAVAENSLKASEEVSLEHFPAKGTAETETTTTLPDADGSIDGVSPITITTSYRRFKDDEGNYGLVTESPAGASSYTGYVLYACPNWWMQQKDVRKEEPIDEDRRTCVMIMAPYKGVMYYYRVPLMQYLPDDADSYDTTTDDGWKEFVSRYGQHYCVQRNHIYDIIVTIDMEGGETEPQSVLVTNLQYQVQPWTDRESDDITFF